ncbi:hypothetical protein T440DRAFT_532187 [Plenodomus tracheiphilus IPT5]|uniref:DUF7872 domain-containing protein n=1 Tax=Plenodomus tracheiphilus IPT5 TaxID=1408161 RepID=A0A6A7B581_9PLEO|nr:hypothetical protein T440DRAFT_532187 [Plenodomus tracheiphilus IPT5]
MRSHLLFAAVGVTVTVASPVPNPQGTGTGADSCPSDALEPKTWTDLNVDGVLTDAAGNYTKTKTNNIQSLADFFGAPNFFCGLDNFCNAGQPCLPVEVPAWYAVVAIQNWNNYMNCLNTAIGFATSILSLKLPEIVQDLFPDPKDDVTPLATMIQVVNGVLAVVPFTGAVSTASTVVSTGLGFLSGRVKPPAATDRFLAWSDISSSMSEVLKDYQTAVSNSVKAVLDAPIDDPDNGINGILAGGNFLGVSQNFTQDDVQKLVIDSITVSALGLALQAQKAFVVRFFNQERCNDENENTLCIQNDGSSTFTQWSLLKRSGDANAGSLIDESKLLLDKYGLTKLEFLKGPTNCFDNNDKKQLTNPFNQGLPLDSKAECVFNVLVCDIDNGNGGAGKQGIVDFCKENQSLDI